MSGGAEDFQCSETILSSNGAHSSHTFVKTRGMCTVKSEPRCTLRPLCDNDDPSRTDC